jgi:hypothetical protein
LHGDLFPQGDLAFEAVPVAHSFGAADVAVADGIEVVNAAIVGDFGSRRLHWSGGGWGCTLGRLVVVVGSETGWSQIGKCQERRRQSYQSEFHNGLRITHEWEPLQIIIFLLRGRIPGILFLQLGMTQLPFAGLARPFDASGSPFSRCGLQKMG